MGGRPTYSRHVDALRIVCTKSEVAAQAEAQVHVCALLWLVGLTIVVSKSEMAAQVEATHQKGGLCCIGSGLREAFGYLPDGGVF